MPVSVTEKRWRELYTAFAAALLPDAVSFAVSSVASPDEGRAAVRRALAYAREAADLALDIEWEAWRNPSARDPAYKHIGGREPGE